MCVCVCVCTCACVCACVCACGVRARACACVRACFKAENGCYRQSIFEERSQVTHTHTHTFSPPNALDMNICITVIVLHC